LDAGRIVDDSVAAAAWGLVAVAVERIAEGATGGFGGGSVVPLSDGSMVAAQEHLGPLLLDEVGNVGSISPSHPQPKRHCTLHG
jgi:hypothetical protein